MGKEGGKKLTETFKTTVHSSEEPLAMTLDGLNTASHQTQHHQSQLNQDQDRPEYYSGVRLPSPGLLKHLIPEEPRSPRTKHEITKQAREKVIEQAFQRCLQDVEKDALDEDFIKSQAQSMYEKFLESEAKKKKRAADLTLQLQGNLDAQIEEYEERKVHEKKERKDAVIKLIGETNTQREERMKEEREKLLRQLQAQIKSKEDRIARQKESKIQEEREYLDHIAMELDLQSAMERASFLSKQQHLLEGWERDGHIKNLKKLQAGGLASIRDYISTNLSPGHGASGKGYNSSRGSMSSRGVSSMSVGFDSRR